MEECFSVVVSLCSRSSEESHVEAGHFESVVYLRLWSGDLQGALQLATEKGELNDHLLSIAPMGKGLFRVDSAYLASHILCIIYQFKSHQN